MNVLVTGAGGTVGTAVREQLGDDPAYEFAYTDREEVPDVETHVADLREYDALRPAFEGQDAVVHLGHDTALNWRVTDVAWTDVLETNLRGTVNAFRAAVDAGLEKMLFASTIHVVGTYEHELQPDIWEPDFDLVVDHTDVRPDSMYAVVKCFGEAMGRFCADFHDLSCYCLRFGGILPTAYDNPYGPAERAVAAGDVERGSAAYDRRVAQTKSHWFSHRDLAALLDSCLRDESVEFDVFYGVSDNDRRWVDIEHAREVVGYDPVDDAEEWTAPPEEP